MMYIDIQYKNLSYTLIYFNSSIYVQNSISVSYNIFA